MGIKERKAREKEAFRKLVLDTAHNILRQRGLEGLTMRAISSEIEYSQSKIYEIFSSKEELFVVLFQELCEKLLAVLKSSPLASPKEHLMNIFHLETDFHLTHPHSDALFTAIYFGSKSTPLPSTFIEIEDCFSDAVRALKSPLLRTDEEVSEALDIFRCIFVGFITLMSSETSTVGKKRVQKMSQNALKVLLQGWKVK